MSANLCLMPNVMLIQSQIPVPCCRPVIVCSRCCFWPRAKICFLLLFMEAQKKRVHCSLHGCKTMVKAKTNKNVNRTNSQRETVMDGFCRRPKLAGMCYDLALQYESVHCTCLFPPQGNFTLVLRLPPK